MKYAIVVLLLLCSPVSLARDEYGKRFNTVVSSSRSNVVIKSELKIPYDDIQYIFYLEKHAKVLFFNAFPNNRCRTQSLEIRLVKDKEVLNDPVYFPQEQSYAKDKEFLYGRYYKLLNLIYIVPMSVEGWDAKISHEFFHYLFDECGPELSVQEEHTEIEKLINKNYR